MLRSVMADDGGTTVVVAGHSFDTSSTNAATDVMGRRCHEMTMDTPAAVEAEIRTVMKARQEAVQAKDAARLVAHHAADVVAYDLLEPLQYKGIEGVRRRAQQWFDGYDGPMTYEIRDLV